MIQSESVDLKIMNSEILLKIGNFIKKRLIETTGILLLVVAIFLLVSISSYSPGDPNFIYTPENVDIKNWGGFFGSVISDFILQAARGQNDVQTAKGQLQFTKEYVSKYFV